MSAMENRDEVLQMLERFTRLKQKEIPRELEDYLSFVARTGDTVYPWPAVKYFFRTKLSLVIMDFHDNTPSIADLPQCPNVDPFCYDRMRRTLLSRMDSFNSAPFTIQRICELLNEPRKHYTRIDKFMRAVEKNILVVSTQEPGRRRSDSENGDSLDSIVNGDLEVNVDIEMDNEAFGIDSNEMVTNAAAATTEAVIPPITTPASADEVPPMESSEEQEQETENHEPETVPEIALTDNGVEVEEINDAKTEEALPKEVKESDKSSATEEEASDQTEKLLYSDEVEPASPEACALDSKEEPLSNVVEAVGTDVLDQKERNEAPAQESHDTSKPTATEKPPNAIAPETDNDSIDDGEPKAKMAKLSQEQPESETADLKATTVPAEKSPADPDKDTVSSESTTDSNGSSVEYVDCSNSPEERTETGVVLLSSSSESIVNIVAISSDEISESGEILPSPSPDTTLSESSSVNTVGNPVPSAEQEKQVELERPAKQTTTTDEPQTTEQTSEAPSEPATAVEPVVSIAKENEETVVKRINLEANPPSTNESEQPAAPRVNSDDMETLSSVVSENVMATDEEEQPQPGAVDAAVPMAADASETAKPDENAMDIDESSVEPMDQ
ncbi:serine/threonine-protein phosphatase 4 regulatory subunit 2 [Ochlerotatus camptorhynchus]|uniref:serine/threonine-protein phosphatase 4 regulatory subunit 2 n=1 Tax=Ochlerotatus camptorhynchus TaxID=644619 RepID=UPI0031D0E11F